MSFDRSDPALTYTLPFQLTKKLHRTVPNNLRPESPDLNASGKIVVITGGGSGIGAVSSSARYFTFSSIKLMPLSLPGGGPRMGHSWSRRSCDCWA